MAAVSAVMIQGGFLFYGIVGNVKIAVFRNEELIPLGTGHTVDVLAQDKYVEGVLTRDSFTGRGRGGNFQQWNA